MTNKAMAQMNDYEFAVTVLQEKLGKIENPNTPMANRLRVAIHGLRRQDILERTRKKSWWEIVYTDEDGNIVASRDMPEVELERIGDMVREGYYQGQIDFEADSTEEYYS